MRDPHQSKNDHPPTDKQRPFATPNEQNNSLLPLAEIDQAPTPRNGYLYGPGVSPFHIRKLSSPIGFPTLVSCNQVVYPGMPPNMYSQASSPIQYCMPFRSPCNYVYHTGPMADFTSAFAANNAQVMPYPSTLPGASPIRANEFRTPYMIPPQNIPMQYTPYSINNLKRLSK